MGLKQAPEPVSAEVIDIADARVERLGLREPEWRSLEQRCGHKHSDIDEKLHAVLCRDCGERLDPIEVLIDIAKNWRSESMHAKRIAAYQRDEWDKETDRRKRRVRVHVRCHGCGIESRLTTGKLTPDDWAAWERHWQAEPVSWWGDDEGAESHVHRRQTEADVEASRRFIEPARLNPGSHCVERAPA